MPKIWAVMPGMESEMTFFDNVGHRIAPLDMGHVPSVSRKHRLAQPPVDFALRLKFMASALANSYLPLLSSTAFDQRCCNILHALAQNEAVSGLMSGVYLPICLPQFRVEDYGSVMEQVFLKAVERANSQRSKSRRFWNNLAGKLSQKVQVVPESRHERLLAQMAKGPVAAIYFPTVLQGFSVDDCRSQMKDLPPNFLLSGGIDTAVAAATYADVFDREDNSQPLPPELTMGALQWQPHSDLALSISSGKSDVCVNSLANIYYAMGDYSSGLLVIEDDGAH